MAGIQIPTVLNWIFLKIKIYVKMTVILSLYKKAFGSQAPKLSVDKNPVLSTCWNICTLKIVNNFWQVKISVVVLVWRYWTTVLTNGRCQNLLSCLSSWVRAITLFYYNWSILVNHKGMKSSTRVVHGSSNGILHRLWG